MKPITSVFILLTTLLLLVSPSLGDFIYSITQDSSLTWVDLRTAANTNIKLNQQFQVVQCINGLDSKSDGILDLIISKDYFSISLVQADMVHGNVSTLSTIRLPTGVSTGNILSFSTLVNNQKESIFFTQNSEYSSLNLVSWSTGKISTIQLFSEPVSKIKVTEDVGSDSFLITGILNGNYVFVWADFNNGVTKKAQITSPQKPVPLFDIISVRGNSYLVEYDAYQFIFSEIDWDKQELIPSKFVGASSGVNFFKLTFTDSLGVITTTSPSGSIVYTFETPNINNQNNQRLPITIPLDASIFFRPYQKW